MRRVPMAALVVAAVALGMPQAQTTFYEHDGLVVVEVEGVPPGTNWYARTGDFSVYGPNTVAGYTGSACYQFEGNTEAGGSVNGIMTYNIHIQNAGTYRLHMRTMEANPESMAGDQGNDCYIKMVGQEGCEGQFTKYVWLGAAYEWGWSPRLECSHHSFSDPVYTLSAGTHQFQIAGRSKNFVLDRFSLVRDGSTINGTDIDLVQSPTDPTVTPLPIVQYIMKATDFPHAGTGFVKQIIWLSLDPADADRTATVADVFPYASGPYNVRLYCVAENVGRSSYRVWVGDDLLGTYTVPLTDQGTELGIDFRGAWDNVQVSTGDEIRVEASAGTLDNVSWTRAGWQKLTFMPQFDVNNVAVDSRRKAPAAEERLRMSPHGQATVYALDGRRVGRAGPAGRRVSHGVYVVRSPDAAAAMMPPLR